MSGRRLAGGLVIGSVGASVVTGLALAVLSTGLVDVAEDSWVPPSTPAPVRAAEATTADSTDTRQLQVHVLAPRSVPIGGSRQLRVQVSDDHVGDAPRHERLRIELRSGDRRISVRPEVLIVTRADLAWTRFELAARADLTCEDQLAGVVEVTVTPLLDPERAGVRRVAMPGIDCREAPPAAPASVHVTDAVCGDDHEEQAHRLLDDEHLDPRRCAPDRWRDGELQPWPPPPPPPRPRPTPAPEPTGPEEEQTDSDAADTDTEAAQDVADDPDEDIDAGDPQEAGQDNDRAATDATETREDDDADTSGVNDDGSGRDEVASDHRGDTDEHDSGEEDAP